jgi:hypothetical protein
MPQRLIILLLAVCVLLVVPALPACQQPPDSQLADDEHLVRPFLPPDTKIDTKVLAGFFGKLTLSDADQKRIAALIAQLNAASFKERDQATSQLIAEGLPALPLLQKPAEGATLEQTKRMERCAKAIVRPGWNDAVAAAARLLAHYSPSNAASVLLAFAPFAPDDLPDEILAALDSATKKAGKVDAALLAALESPKASQRAIAAVLVGAHGTAEERQAVVRLLEDADPLVRFHAAQGFLVGRDKTGVPVLVSLLKHGPATLAENAESLLQEIAAATAPIVLWRDTKEDREKSWKAWQAWWQEHQNKVDLAKLDSGLWLINSERLAKDVGIKCFAALSGVDKVTLRKIAAVPFRWGDGRILQNYDDLYNVLNGQKTPEDLLKQFPFKQIVPAKEFVKIARPEDKDYINQLHGGRFFVVSWTFAGGPGQLGLVVRVRGATARATSVVASQN